LPEREIMTGIGPVGVRAPRVRDRVGQCEARIRFSSAILPPYGRRSKSLEVLIAVLYLKGISTGDFEEALIALLGKDAGGLSASAGARLKDAWIDEHMRWSKRDLTAKRYVYFWVDGINVQARLEDDAVIVGVTPEGKKEFVGLADGVGESTQSWKGTLLDLRRRGLTIGPELAVADGALGFWKAFEEVWPKTRGQRCWVHKTAIMRCFARLLRLPGRALDGSAHIEPSRKHIRDRAPPDGTLEGVPIQQNRSRHDLQACRESSPRWTKPIANGYSRSKVHGRSRGCKRTSSNCRLTPSSPTFDHSASARIHGHSERQRLQWFSVYTTAPVFGARHCSLSQSLSLFFQRLAYRFG
jgi:Transposase, Mutator family